MKNKLSILVGFIMLTGVVGLYAAEDQSLNFDADGLKIGEKFIPVQAADIDPLRGVNQYRDAIRDVNSNVWYLLDNGASPEVVSKIKDDASKANIFATEANEKANSVDAKATQAQIDAADAKEDASTAKSTATEAKSTADAIDDKASQALTNSSAAQTASSSALANANTAAENANTAVANAAAATQAVANKVDKSYVDVTAISAGGTIFNFITDATKEGGSIAENIAQQVTEKTGPIYDAINDGAGDAITTAVASGGAIDAIVSTKADTDYVNIQLGAKADKTDLESYSTTVDLNTTFNTKADKTDLDAYTTTTDINNLLGGKVNTETLDNYALSTAIPGIVESTISSGSGLQLITDEANRVVITSIASGGSIHTAVTDDTSDLSKILDTKIESKASGVPVGTIVMWGKAIIPDDWLELDGETIPPAYPALAALYGANVPDFRGMFVRGYDPDGTIDPDGTTRGLLSIQDDATAKPKIDFRTSSNGVQNVTAMTDEDGDGRGKFVVGDRSKNQHTVQTAPNHTHTIASGGDAETRPTNISVIYIIKAR